MQSKREKILIRPWEEKRYENHKRKIQSARPAIDFTTPAQYFHITNKLKKQQSEKERLENIKKENIRLLQKLGDIMRGKRIENFWTQPRPNFLNREAIFKSNKKRPQTCTDSDSGLATKINSPNFETWNSRYTSNDGSNRNNPLRNSSIQRCPTCSGRPVKRNLVIPEERIPWQPPKKSWNVKLTAEDYGKHKCCKVCCR